jgi:hypothetical protein
MTGNPSFASIHQGLLLVIYCVPPYGSDDVCRSKITFFSTQFLLHVTQQTYCELNCKHAELPDLSGQLSIQSNWNCTGAPVYAGSNCFSKCHLQGPDVGALQRIMCRSDGIWKSLDGLCTLAVQAGNYVYFKTRQRKPWPSAFQLARLYSFKGYPGQLPYVYTEVIQQSLHSAAENSEIWLGAARNQVAARSSLYWATGPFASQMFFNFTANLHVSLFYDHFESNQPDPQGGGVRMASDGFWYAAGFTVFVTTFNRFYVSRTMRDMRASLGVVVMFTLPPAATSPIVAIYCGNTGFCSCIQTSVFCAGMEMGQLPETPPPANTIEFRLDNNNLTTIPSFALVDSLNEIYLDNNQLVGLPAPVIPLPSLTLLSIKVLVLFINFHF